MWKKEKMLVTESKKHNIEKGENAGNQHFLLLPHCVFL